MCRSTAADFDGDEVHLYFITQECSISECSSWKGTIQRSFNMPQCLDTHKRLYGVTHSMHDMDIECNFMYAATLSLDNMRSEIHGSLAKQMSTTGLSESHISKFLHMWDTRLSADDVFKGCVKTMNAKLSKQSMQSEIGYTSRRVKVASLMHYSMVIDRAPANYGHQALRGISKISRPLMQEMLTTKSGTAGTGEESPALSLLVGSKRTVIAYGSQARRSSWNYTMADTSDTMSDASRRFQSSNHKMTYNCQMAAHLHSREDMMAACTQGVWFVMQHCSAEAEQEEVTAVAECMCNAAMLGMKGLVFDKNPDKSAQLAWLPYCHSMFYSTAHKAFGESLGKQFGNDEFFNALFLANIPKQSSILNYTPGKSRSLAGVREGDR